VQKTVLLLLLLIPFCLSTQAQEILLAPTEPQFAGEASLKEAASAMPATGPNVDAIEKWPKDSVERAFVDVLSAYRRMALDNAVESTEAFYNQAKRSSETFPESATLAGLYGYATLYYSGASEAVLTLVPYADRWTESPAISITLYRAFTTHAYNFQHNSKRIPGPSLFVGDVAAMRDKAEALAVSWAQRIDVASAGRLATPDLVTTAKRGFATVTQQKLATAAWEEIVCLYGARRAEGSNDKAEIERAEQAHQQTLNRLKERDQLTDDAYQRSVASILELREGDRSLQRLERAFASLQRFSKRAGDEFPQTPHYDSFSGHPVAKVDADLIDAVYQLSVLQNPKSAMTALHRNPSWQNDVRAIYIAAFSSLRLKEWDEAAKFAAVLIEKNPKDYRARRLLLAVEEARERESTTQPEGGKRGHH